MVPVIIIAIAMAAALLAAILGTDTLGGFDMDTTMRVVAAVLMLSLVGAGTLGGYRGKFNEAIKAAFAWLAIGFVLVAGYAFSFELAAMGNRVAGALVPGVMLFGQGGEVTVSRGSDGQFHLGGKANGHALRMMFDTGASSVVLREEDARAMGIRLDEADFTLNVRTANGVSRAAPVTLRSLEIGGIHESDVRAIVAQAGRLSEPLLGMTFLERLSSYEVRAIS